MPKTQNSKSQNLDKVVGKAAKGLSMLMVVKIISKFLQLFLNFEVIRHIEPKIYGLTVYFNFLIMNQTFLTQSSFREVYQKRVKSVDQETVNTSARNLVRDSLLQISSKIQRRFQHVLNKIWKINKF